MKSPFKKYTLREAAKVIIENLHVCDIEAQEIADRISGQRGAQGQPPDGVQVLEDGEKLINASVEYFINHNLERDE